MLCVLFTWIQNVYLFSILIGCFCEVISSHRQTRRRAPLFDGTLIQTQGDPIES